MSQSDTKPWWRFGHLWLVIAGPLLVVVASFITLYLAVSRPDPVISDEASRRATEASSQSGGESNLAPAMQARNHAQTGVPPNKALGVER